MKTGDNVTVHDPSWHDATGRQYEAGKHHGKSGVITEITEHKVGSERMYRVALEDGLDREFWTSELRVLPALTVTTPRAEQVGMW